MPANRFNDFTDYGIGIGLRIPHYKHILDAQAGGRLVRDHLRKFHGRWRAPAAHPRPDSRAIPRRAARRLHVFRLRRTAQPRASATSENAGASAPKRPGSPIIFAGAAWMAATRTTCCRCPTPSRPPRITAQKIREVRDFLEVPIAVENVSSYAEFHVSEMTEWEFLTEVVERADCGILLDVNNIYVSSQNHSFDPFDYLNSVPPERVAQIHIAGHSKYREIHSRHPRSSGDRSGLETVCPTRSSRAGHTATLLEWDDRIPSFDEVHDEALKANKFLASASLAAAV